MLDLTGQRSAGLKIARSCPVVLGGQTYELRVLTIAGNERWNAELDANTAALVDEMTKKGARDRDILLALSAQTDQMIELLLSYDRAGDSVLPTAEALKEVTYADELLAAVTGVWRAANPLVDIALRTLSATRTSPSSPPTSSPPTPTAGRRKKSATN